MALAKGRFPYLYADNKNGILQVTLEEWNDKIS